MKMKHQRHPLHAHLLAAAIACCTFAPASAQHANGTVTGLRLILEGDRSIANITSRAAAHMPPPRSTLNEQLSRSAVSGTTASRRIATTTTTPAATTPPAVAQDKTLFEDRELLSEARLCAPLHNPAIREALNHLMREALYQDAEARIKTALPGFGLHSQTNHQLANACEARASLDGRQLTVSMKLPRNRAFLRVTTPRGWPGDLDPNFVVFYDLDIEFGLILPYRASDPLQLLPASVRATHVTQPASRSITGNIALVAGDIARSLGERDFIGELRADKHIFESELTTIDLGALRRELGNLPRDRRIEHSLRGQQLLLLATERSEAASHFVR